ncbi:MAG: NUDIX hydrolase [Pseudomonadota bacterium]
MTPPHWPQLGCGAIVRRGDAVLLVKRGRAPKLGQWAIPGGKVDAGESMRAAVEREILEETSIVIRAGEMVYQLEYIEHDKDGALAFHYVVLDFAAEYLSGEVCAGDDAEDAAWVRLDELSTLTLTDSTREALLTLFPDEFS